MRSSSTTVMANTVPPYVVMEVLPASRHHRRQNSIPGNYNDTNNSSYNNNDHSSSNNDISQSRFGRRISRINSLENNSLCHGIMPFMFSPNLPTHTTLTQPQVATATMHATASIRGFSPSPALTGLGFASPVRPVFSAFDSYRTFSSYSDDSRNYSNTNLLQRNDNNISNNAMYNSVKDSNNSSNYNISRENMQPLIDNTFLCPNTTAATLQPHNAFFNASLESFHPQALAGSMQLPIPDLYNSQRISYFPQLNQQHQLEHQQQRPLDSYSSAYPEARSPIFLHFGPRSPVVTHNHSHHSIEPSLPSPTSPPRSPFNEHIASTTPQQPQQPQQQYLHHFMLPGSHGGGIAKPPRFKPNENELTLLTAVFTKNPYPSSTIRKKLAEKMGLEIKQIQFWFQNRRALSKVQGNPLSKPKKGISDVSLSGYEVSEITVMISEQ